MEALAGSQCAVRVIDRGPGVPAETQARIFDRFVRAEPAREAAVRSGSGGAGLGLSIARRIAEMHGGTLVLESSAPGRTVFRLTLPVDDALRV
jgi:two-component system, OmpR family, sensor kinase